MKKIICVFLVISALFVFAPTSSALDTSARAAVLMDKATGTVIYSKNSVLRRPMASTTKIMTAIIVLENANLNDICKISSADANTEGSALGLSAGDELTVENMLNGLLLVSGNDAANALAKTVSGSIAEFVKLMNLKAKNLGLKNTHFENPSGLPNKNHYSSAYDMAVLSSYALSNEKFASICAKKSAVIRFNKPIGKIEVYNHNRLLNTYKGCIGIKTGFTEAAGRCLVSAAKRNGATLIAVTLGDGDDWLDHKKMLDYGFSKYEKVDFNEGSINVHVAGSTSTFIKVYEKSACPLEVPNSIKDKIKTEIILPHFVYAPVKKGEKIGSVVYKLGNKTIAQNDLISLDDAQILEVKKGFLERIIDFLKGK